MKKNYIFLYATILSLFFMIYSCKKAGVFNINDIDEQFSADIHTAFDEGSGAYAHPLTGLTSREVEYHDLGDHFFGSNFIPTADHSYLAGGLGPLYNNNSCEGCHQADGRGRPPFPGESMNSMFFKMAVPGLDSLGFPNKVPGYGAQLQDKAIAGHKPEGKIGIVYIDSIVNFPDGEKAKLRKPVYTLQNLYTAIPGNVILSPRVARQNFGIGFLEAISAENILANHDPDDLDQDGISGKVNYVYDFVNQKSHVIGRIGWKASVANIQSQVVRALNEDIGIRSYILPKEHSYNQDPASRNIGIELPDTIVDAITFYIKTLSVPARRNVNDEQVKLGKKIFYTSGCVKCHTPMQQTAVNLEFRQLSGLTIFPYTDLLLHDMGSGLADGFSEFDANGNEWRTPPLWGIGLTQKISGHTFFLHDGRARNFIEAILWHDGEAAKAKNSFTQLTKEEREAVVKFLESL